MSFAVVALVLGLVLLLVAAGLFLRASRPTAQVDRAVPGGAPGARPASRPVQGAHRAETPTVRPVPHGSPTPEPDPASSPVASPAAPATSAADKDATPEPVPAPAPEATTPSSDPSGFSGRRGRRHWASAHGFEYAREDAFLTAEWPVSLIREISGTDQGPAARDLVSGFIDGHQVHIADVAGSTLLALRRGAYSPVDVHLTTAAAMPAGMRHDAALDRTPFTVYASDTRAVGRMLDSRVEGALAGMVGTVSDIAFSGAWVVARCARRTDADRWSALLPHLAALGAAGRVLPPLVTTATLDIAAADPTRPRPASGVRVTVAATDSATDSATDGSAATAAAPRPGHLRAVPDSPVPEPEPTTDDAAGGHPRVERPADPVEFPTRSRGRIYGDADLDGSWPEDVDADGLTSIPALGEEPTGAGRGSGEPRIVRTGASATIFSDQEGPAGDTGQGPRGRHRGPDARHAGADRDSVDGDDAYDVVDPEVVDPDD